MIVWTKEVHFVQASLIITSVVNIENIITSMPLMFQVLQRKNISSVDEKVVAPLSFCIWNLLLFNLQSLCTEEAVKPSLIVLRTLSSPSFGCQGLLLVPVMGTVTLLISQLGRWSRLKCLLASGVVGLLFLLAFYGELNYLWTKFPRQNAATTVTLG